MSGEMLLSKVCRNDADWKDASKDLLLATANVENKENTANSLTTLQLNKSSKTESEKNEKQISLGPTPCMLALQWCL